MTQAEEIVYTAIDEINSDFDDKAQFIEKNDEFPLLGEEGTIDSLTFLNLIVCIEGKIQAQNYRSVVLVNEHTLSGKEHPFKTVGSLIEYVSKFLS